MNERCKIMALRHSVEFNRRQRKAKTHYEETILGNNWAAWAA
jgi:hypothetical protein